MKRLDCAGAVIVLAGMSGCGGCGDDSTPNIAPSKAIAICMRKLR